VPKEKVGFWTADVPPIDESDPLAWEKLNVGFGTLDGSADGKDVEVVEVGAAPVWKDDGG